ncbi:hypothetical protein [Brevundimonas sp. AAP58]|uniref:hypothetical protein n=1 Tax=Brevundimonas sp. AAP58 TaxID=1523422 RepID=UPI0012E1E567|nr:hypothetical protein [Brevundimonas sp. AAP58]
MSKWSAACPAQLGERRRDSANGFFWDRQRFQEAVAWMWVGRAITTLRLVDAVRGPGLDVRIPDGEIRCCQSANGRFRFEEWVLSEIALPPQASVIN